MSDQVCLCLHGHFYQPPRENPWLEAIEVQESATPYHDWNERIYHECYLPNSMARILDERGHISNIVNNFEKISFNFGPTLFSWLRGAHPEVYRRVVDADRVSRQAHQGHGNAIAQVYNHMIMPLASRRDKETQVRWGMAEFRHHYGREPESVWLPETACNEETLEVLVAEGVRFIILEPHQAEAVRPLTGEGEPEAGWHGVEHGEIDPRQPYRCFLRKDRSRFIDIFFYDGPISKAVAFEDLLMDAKRFMGKLEMARLKDHQGPQLIHVSTDGETFGHHKVWGDRVLAYLLNAEAPSRGYRLVNYGEYLAENPPKQEVRLKEGENGEGTSWSCPHGVRRWKDHCGCRGGGPGEWHQRWRKPLREALDWLRDELAGLYQEYGSCYFRDVWEVRDDYIQVMLDRSPKNVAEFLGRYSTRPLTNEEVTTCLSLLEMQRHCMLMYTSCGWFFTEISGIETVQILQYAARAIQLALEVSGKSYEEPFKVRLSKAESNMALFKDGRGVYDTLVKPRTATMHHIVSLYAIGSIFEDYFEKEERLSIYSYDLQIMQQRKESYGSLTLNFGHVKARSRTTFEDADLIFIAVQIGHYDFRCSVKPYLNQAEYEKLEKEFFESLYTLHILELMRKIDQYFGEVYDALKDLPLADRLRIISILTRETIEKISGVYENLYDEHLRMNEIYRSINVPIPAEVHYAAEHTLEKRLRHAVRQLAAKGFSLKRMTPITRTIEAARAFNVRIRKDDVALFLNAELERRMKELLYNARSDVIAESLHIIRLARKIEVRLDLMISQDYFFSLIKEWCEHPDLIPKTVLKSGQHLLQLMNELEIASEPFKKMIHHLMMANPDVVPPAAE
jgi:alpha-amylase/alpha-mannosidase (GH57 family)